MANDLMAAWLRVRRIVGNAFLNGAEYEAASADMTLVEAALKKEDDAWVKCSTKRYPDLDEYVQVLHQDDEPQYSCVTIAIWRGSDCWYDPMTGDLVEGITAWRELSDVPEWAK